VSEKSMSLYQIRMEGWKALTERLGPAGAMRFMMQYDPGPRRLHERTPGDLR